MSSAKSSKPPNAFFLFRAAYSRAGQSLACTISSLTAPPNVSAAGAVSRPRLDQPSVSRSASNAWHSMSQEEQAVWYRKAEEVKQGLERKAFGQGEGLLGWTEEDLKKNIAQRQEDALKRKESRKAKPPMKSRRRSHADPFSRPTPSPPTGPNHPNPCYQYNGPFIVVPFGMAPPPGMVPIGVIPPPFRSLITYDASIPNDPAGDSQATAEPPDADMLSESSLGHSVSRDRALHSKSSRTMTEQDPLQEELLKIVERPEFHDSRTHGTRGRVDPLVHEEEMPESKTLATYIDPRLLQDDEY